MAVGSRPDGHRRPAASPAITQKTTRRINLALQGGGTHGAFTWARWTACWRMSASSSMASPAIPAGAINGAILALGLLEGGRQVAKDALNRSGGRWCQIRRLAPQGAPDGKGALGLGPDLQPCLQRL